MPELDKLHPDWISPPGRFGVGLQFDCPGCWPGKLHRVSIFFVNPVDGDSQLDAGWDEMLHTRDPGKSGLGDVTLFEPVELEHWHGYLVDGDLVQI